MIDDATLLRRYAEENSEAAFAELVQRHVSLVYHAALRQVGGDVHRAQDIAQSVFADLARKARDLAGREVIASWLYTSTRYAAAKARRAERRRAQHELEAAMHEKINLPQDGAEWDRLRPMIDEVMHELNVRDRAAVVLRFFEQRPFAEIGRAPGLSEDGARMRVDRALDKLHALLARRGVTSTASAVGVLLTHQAAAAAPAGLAAAVCHAALAKTATAAGGSAGLLTFMSTTKIAVATATLALLAVGTATYEMRARSAATALLAAKQHEMAALSDRRSDLEQRIARVKQNRTTLENQLNNAQAAPGGSAAQAGAGSRTAAAATMAPVSASEERAASDAFLARHPELKTAIEENGRARVRFNYGPLYRALKLTPAQIEQFESLLIEYEGVRLSSSRGEKDIPTSFWPGSGRSRDEVERRVRDLLGDSGYREYRDTWGWGWTHTWAQRIAGMLCYTDSPLTFAQTESLSHTFRVAGQENKKQDGTTLTYWNRILATAREFLSEPQLETLNGYGHQQLYEAGVRAALGFKPAGTDMVGSSNQKKS